MPSETSVQSPHNARAVARLKFTLIRIVTSGDNHTSLLKELLPEENTLNQVTTSLGGPLKETVKKPKEK